MSKRAQTDTAMAFGSSHALARQVLLVALFFILFGFAVLILADDAVGPGSAIAGFGIALSGICAYRIWRPADAAIVLLRDGLVVKDVSQRIIPWGQIQSVEIHNVKEFSMPTTKRVASIAVTRSFLTTLTPQTLWPSEVVSVGEPTLIHLGYYHPDVDADELADAIEAHRSAWRDTA